MDFPLISKGGKELKRFKVGGVQLVFIEEPESIGLIKYKYVCIAQSPQSSEPLLITAEHNTLSPNATNVASQGQVKE